jgi:hypothetical protein
LRLADKKGGPDATDAARDLTPIWIFFVIPMLSLALPLLLQLNFVTPLLIVKRLYVYLLAGSVVTIASLRGATDNPSLGTRLVELTKEVLPDGSGHQQQQRSERFQEMAVLDQVEGSTQAVALPLLVVSSLITSVFFITLQATEVSLLPTSIIFSSGLRSLVTSIQSFLPYLFAVSNAVVVSLFARAELKRLLPDKEAVASIAAFTLALVAYLGPSSAVWPFQNVLNVCVAVNVARAIQLSRLTLVLSALGGLVVYDVVSVALQLIQLGSESVAQSSGTSAFSAASSAMGAVAMAKATGSIWQPGLFEVQLRGRVTDLLGLGDAVFPTLLSVFARRYDMDQSERTHLFLASLSGFFFGTLSCEFVPGISTSGLPALLFIVPFMVTSVLGWALVNGGFESLLSYDTEKRNV